MVKELYTTEEAYKLMQEGEAVRCSNWRISDHYFYMLNGEILFSDTTAVCSLYETFIRAYADESWEIYECGYIIFPPDRKCKCPIAKDGKWYY